MFPDNFLHIGRAGRRTTAGGELFGLAPNLQKWYEQSTVLPDAHFGVDEEKIMKKMLSLLLILAMAASMTACSGTDVAEEPPEETEDAVVEAVPVYEELELSVAVAESERDAAGFLAAYFTNYITEHSGSRIKFNISYDGAMGMEDQNLDLVGSGSADLSITDLSAFSDQLPLVNFPAFAYGSQKAAVNYAQYIAFDNEESASLIEAELAEKNVVAIGINASGTNGYFFTADYPTAAAAADDGVTMGCSTNSSCYEALGFNTVETPEEECFDQLSDGTIGGTHMTVNTALEFQIQNAAPYVILDEQYSVGLWWLMNRDVWDGLSEDAQQLFREAADATQDYSIILLENEIADLQYSLDEAGGIMYYLPNEESRQEQEIFYQQCFEDCRINAANAGKSDEMEIILEASSEYLDIQVQ